MLIICNGAFKSGSTWLYCLLRSFFPEIEPLPSEFHQDGEWNGETVPVDKLPEFLRRMDLKGKNYIFKSHYDGERERDLLLSHSDVVVFNIKRDLRDVIVSAYFHFKRLKIEKREFNEYYWDLGRGLIHYLKRFHQLWCAIPGKVYVSSYERLHTEFNAEVSRIARFLELQLDDALLTRLSENVSLDTLRSWWKETNLPEEERFFRKGIIGDWKTHFTPEISCDFHHLDRSPAAAAQAESNSWMHEHIRVMKVENEILLSRQKQLETQLVLAREQAEYASRQQGLQQAELRQQLAVQQSEIDLIRNSYSYRLGTILLWPARMIHTGWKQLRVSVAPGSKGGIKP